MSDGSPERSICSGIAHHDPGLPTIHDPLAERNQPTMRSGGECNVRSGCRGRIADRDVEAAPNPVHVVIAEWDHGEVRLSRAGKGEGGPAGSLHLLCAFQPEGLDKGIYSLLVTLRNKANGTEGQSAIPIEIR